MRFLCYRAVCQGFAGYGKSTVSQLRVLRSFGRLCPFHFSPLALQRELAIPRQSDEDSGRDWKLWRNGRLFSVYAIKLGRRNFTHPVEHRIHLASEK